MATAQNVRLRPGGVRSYGYEVSVSSPALALPPRTTPRTDMRLVSHLVGVVGAADDVKHEHPDDCDGDYRHTFVFPVFPSTATGIGPWSLRTPSPRRARVTSLVRRRRAPTGRRCVPGIDFAVHRACVSSRRSDLHPGIGTAGAVWRAQVNGDNLFERPSELRMQRQNDRIRL